MTITQHLNRDADDYQVQFRVRGLPLLLADILMACYRTSEPKSAPTF